jgi:hypothetical protein
MKMFQVIKEESEKSNEIFYETVKEIELSIDEDWELFDEL